jgi:hypothetical protein
MRRSNSCKKQNENWSRWRGNARWPCDTITEGRRVATGQGSNREMVVRTESRVLVYSEIGTRSSPVSSFFLGAMADDVVVAMFARG